VSHVDFWNVTLMLFAGVVLGVYHTDPWSPSLMLLTPDAGVGMCILHIPVLVNVSIPGLVGQWCGLVTCRMFPWTPFAPFAPCEHVLYSMYLYLTWFPHTCPRPRNLADLVPLPGPLRELGWRFEIAGVTCWQAWAGSEVAVVNWNRKGSRIN
ncbi:hypothetical protein COCMIDRAFT_104183, partial [Bipolaris oryzae ATCC 44560]